MQYFVYDEVYNLEDKHWWFIARRQRVLSVLKKILKNKKSTILDAGCGTGKNIKELSQFGNVWGIDIAKQALDYCHQRGIINVKKDNIEKTHFLKNTFDIVTTFDVLEHINDEKALGEINRILRPNGLLVVTVPAFSMLWSTWDTVLHHKRRYIKESLGKILKKKGFQVIYISYMFSFLFIPILIIRKFKSFFLKENYGSDMKSNKFLLSWILLKFVVIEEKISNIIPIPFGTSIICIARKMD